MTLEQLQQKRDQILQSLGLAGTSAANRSVQYPSDEQKVKALARIDAEIARLQAPQTRQFMIQTSRGL